MWGRLVILCAWLGVCFGSEARVVDTAEGPVRGYRDPEGGLYAYYNIPYAKAPTGRDRFKAPLPASSRTYVFEAINRGIICPQSSITDPVTDINQSHILTEDCLIANIFVPDTTKKNLPVVVYVHGGGYIVGLGNSLYYKEFVKSKEIIVVTFNYRLGVHGFLCLGTDAVPGNAGMKDQVALLRWVKENIANFGGNPEDVTIAGFSAGSSSVDLLMISDMAKGLFTKVIPESGANTAAWSVQADPIKNAQDYAKMLNFTDDDLGALEEFYKTTSYEILITKYFDLFYRTDSTFLFSPCVERDTEGEEFLSYSPYDILKSGNYKKVPILYGFAKMEGLLRVPLFEQWKNKMNDNFSDFLPPDLRFNSEEEKQQVAKKVKEFYFGSSAVTEDKIINFVDFFSDVLFTYATLRSVKLHLDNGHDKIYLYEYSFVYDDLEKIPYTDKRGATHCAQSNDVADGNFSISNEILFPKESKDMKKIVRELWSNFITTGQPVPYSTEFPSWPPVDKDWSPHMVIDSTLQLGGSLLKDRTLFWDKIYEKHYQNPLPPHKSTFYHSEL